MHQTATPSIRRHPNSKSSRLRQHLGCLALSALLVGASSDALAYEKHNLYFMLGSGNYSEENTQSGQKTLPRRKYHTGDPGLRLPVFGTS